MPFKVLVQNLMNPFALEHSNKIPFLLFVYEKEGNALGILTPKHGNHHSISYYSHLLDPEGWGCTFCLTAMTATALLVKATEEIIVEYPLTISVSHEVKPSSHHTQYFPVSQHTSYEILQLPAFRITLSYCNNLNSAVLSVPSEDPCKCLMLMDQPPDPAAWSTRNPFE